MALVNNKSSCSYLVSLHPVSSASSVKELGLLGYNWLWWWWSFKWFWCHLKKQRNG